jgi:hypothetical protein
VWNAKIIASNSTSFASNLQGRPTEATMELKQRQYGELDTKEHIPGAEALLEERKLKPDGTLVSNMIFCCDTRKLTNSCTKNFKIYSFVHLFFFLNRYFFQRDCIS